MVLSHDSGGVKDAFRTIYMHLRNGPTHDADNAWNVTVAEFGEPQLSQYKEYLNNTGCPKGGPYNPDPQYLGDRRRQDRHDASQQDGRRRRSYRPFRLHRTGRLRLHRRQRVQLWGGGVNTHLHIFFARRDPTDNEWYFIDPYGIYASGGCYPDFNTPINPALRALPGDVERRQGAVPVAVRHRLKLFRAGHRSHCAEENPGGRKEPCVVLDRHAAKGRGKTPVFRRALCGSR